MISRVFLSALVNGFVIKITCMVLVDVLMLKKMQKNVSNIFLAIGVKFVLIARSIKVFCQNIIK